MRKQTLIVLRLEDMDAPPMVHMGKKKPQRITGTTGPAFVAL
jgi:hypothetical protein